MFHGRREQVSELLQRMAKCRFLAVVGTSGSGKSSLVRAGVLPALYRGYMGTAGSRWRIAVMRPGGMPLRAMAQALGGPDALRTPGEAWNQAAAMETLGQNSLGLADLARQHLIGDPDNLLLIVDQFEEIFRFRRERHLIDGGEEAKAFVNLAAGRHRTNRSARLRGAHDALGLPGRLCPVPGLARSAQPEPVPGAAHDPRAASSVHRRAARVRRASRSHSGWCSAS